MPQCEICGKEMPRAIFGIHTHHFVKQQHWKKNEEWFLLEGIKQREIDLCYLCHDAIHHSSEKTFLKRLAKIYFQRTGIILRRGDFLFNKKEYFNDLLLD